MTNGSPDPDGTQSRRVQIRKNRDGEPQTFPELVLRLILKRHLHEESGRPVMQTRILSFVSVFVVLASRGASGQYNPGVPRFYPPRPPTQQGLPQLARSLAAEAQQAADNLRYELSGTYLGRQSEMAPTPWRRPPRRSSNKWTLVAVPGCCRRSLRSTGPTQHSRRCCATLAGWRLGRRTRWNEFSGSRFRSAT